MDSPSRRLLDDIAAYVRNEDGNVSGLADLPTRWDSETDDLRRELLLAAYVHGSRRKRSAWDGLHRLLRTLLDRDEPIPDDLRYWACLVAAGLLTPPIKPRNPKFAPQDDRNDRIVHMYGYLISKGWPRANVQETIVQALDGVLDGAYVEKIFRKLKLRERIPESLRETL